MPRRLPMRPQVMIGNIFVVLVTFMIGLIYYAYTFLVWLPKAEGKWPPLADSLQTTGACSCSSGSSIFCFSCSSGASCKA